MVIDMAVTRSVYRGRGRKTPFANWFTELATKDRPRMSLAAGLVGEALFGGIQLPQARDGEDLALQRKTDCIATSFRNAVHGKALWEGTPRQCS